MTEFQIVRKNKAIAKFMRDYRADRVLGKTLDNALLFTLDYHSNWNSLMKVVEVIESMEVADEGCYDVEITYLGCQIGDPEHQMFYPISIGVSDTCTKIQSVWLACLQFIEQFNELKNNKKFH